MEAWHVLVNAVLRRLGVRVVRLETLEKLKTETVPKSV